MLAGWLLNRHYSWYLNRHHLVKAEPLEKKKLFFARKYDPDDPVCKQLLADYSKAYKAAIDVATKDYARDHKVLSKLRWDTPYTVASNLILLALIVLVGGIQFWPANAVLAALTVLVAIAIPLIDNWDLNRRARLAAREFVTEERMKENDISSNDG